VDTVKKYNECAAGHDELAEIVKLHNKQAGKPPKESNDGEDGWFSDLVDRIGGLFDDL
jgi:hypothetical protein